MIKYTSGNILDSQAQVLVNPVNTVGVMGKGLALQFKLKHKDNYDQYRQDCLEGRVQTGKMHFTKLAANEAYLDRYIVNFPTKQHWSNPSQLVWITEGLQDLRRFILEKNIKTLALPALGVGNGGLNWLGVMYKIEEALFDLPAEITVYHPNE